MKKSKLENLSQIDGKDHSKQYKITTIDQLLGDRGTLKYRQLENPFDVVEYEEYIKNLAPSDLYSHASELGFLPNDDRKLLLRKLIDEFRANRAAYRQPLVANSESEKNNQKAMKDMPDHLKKFMAEAK